MYPNYAVAVDAGAGFPPGGLNAQNVNSTIGVHAENRPLYQSFSGWIQQGKGAMGCIKTKSEIQSNIGKFDFNLLNKSIFVYFVQS